MDVVSRQLIVLSLSVFALSYLFFFLLSLVLPLFDKSPLLTPHLLPSPLLRWDLFHFLHIAHSGYIYEHEWAFFPGAPAAIYHLPAVPLFLILAFVICDSSRTLYQLSMLHLQSHSLAYLSVILSLLSSSPVAMHLVPYSEPFFTYLSYKGMLYCALEKWWLATAMFALAGTFRSNGFLLSGYILWGMLVRPFLATRKVPSSALGTALLLSSLIFMPFIHQNFIAYTIFCNSSVAEIPSWCAHRFPSIYAYSQSKYWNVGFLRYWTLSQLPNFVIASPIFLLVFNYTLKYTRHCTIFAVPSTDSTQSPFYNTSILPHIIHSVVLFLMLLTNAHTQIALRLAPSVPLIYWSAAQLIAASPLLGWLWISWSIIWGTVSVILWVSFLPPA